MAVTRTETPVVNPSSVQGSTFATTEIVVSPTTSSQNNGYSSITGIFSVSTTNSQSASTRTGLAVFNSFLALSGVAFVLAVGSMFFVRGRVNKESSEES